MFDNVQISDDHGKVELGEHAATGYADACGHHSGSRLPTVIAAGKFTTAKLRQT